MLSTTSPEEILHGLVHDLRQPLGNIETSLFYLELVLGPTSQGVHEHLQNLEIQVAKAAQLLACAADASRQLRDQCAEADSLDFTKSTTAALT